MLHLRKCELLFEVLFWYCTHGFHPWRQCDRSDHWRARGQPDSQHRPWRCRSSPPSGQSPSPRESWGGLGWLWSSVCCSPPSSRSSNPGWGFHCPLAHARRCARCLPSPRGLWECWEHQEDLSTKENIGDFIFNGLCTFDEHREEMSSLLPSQYGHKVVPYCARVKQCCWLYKEKQLL